MKGKIVPLLMLMQASALHAQISLDASDLPQSGQTYLQVSAASLNNYQHTTGSSRQQNWDYSTAFIQTSTQERAFINTNPLGADSIFPAAQVLSKDPARGDAYYIKKADGFYLDGVWVSQGGSYKMDFNPDDLLVPVPFSLGNSRQYNSGYVLFIKDGNSKIKIEVSTENSFLADAYGALKLPSGYYPNTLRVKKSIRYNSKVYFFFNGQYNLVHNEDSNSTEYSWYTKGEQSWLMRVNADLNGVFQTGTYMDKALTHSNPLPALTQDYLLYPNPAGNTLHMQWEHPATEENILELLSSDGRLFMQETLSPGSTHAHINLGDFSPGLYFIRVYSPGTLLYSGRIQVKN